MDELLRVGSNNQSTLHFIRIRYQICYTNDMNIAGKPKKQVIWRDITPHKLLPKQPPAKIAKLLFVKKSLSSFGKAIRKIISKFSKKKIVISGTICVLLIAIGIGCYVFKPSQAKIAKPTKTVQQTTFTIDKLESGTPDYSTVLPTDKNISSLGGWKRVSPSTADAVYAYADKIDNVPISVSEQPLPDNFKTDTANQVEQLAENFNATQKITVGDTIIYLGSSTDGPQSVILNKSNLLILIKSESKIENASWASYVSSLQ